MLIGRCRAWVVKLSLAAALAMPGQAQQPNHPLGLQKLRCLASQLSAGRSAVLWLATEVAPLSAGVYRGAARDRVVSGFSRCEEAPNTRRAASEVPLGCGSVGVVERVDWKMSRVAAQTGFSCCSCHARPGATAHSSVRSSDAPLLGFIAVCSQSAFANRFANMVSPAGKGLLLHRDAMPWCRVSC